MYTDFAIKDFDYPLPQESIAGFPLPERDQSRLLIFREDLISDDHFYNLPRLLPEGTLLVLNDTRVIEARILFTKPTGAAIEIFCLEPFDKPVEQSLGESGKTEWLCLIGGASKWKPGQVLQKKLELNGNNVWLEARYAGKIEDSFRISFSWTPEALTFSEVLHAAGAIPLPPYLKRQPTALDSERYQTVFNRVEGSVAAPTAALHFTQKVFTALRNKGVSTAQLTLHVGAGTFRPVKTETIGTHPMHQEPFTISRNLCVQLLQSRTIIPVGTTSLRSLESLYWMGVKLMKGEADPFHLEQWEAYTLLDRYPGIGVRDSIGALINWMDTNQNDTIQGTTSLIIVPGYPFHLPHALITNFHQPQSTLLLLVAAFIGKNWEKVYDHALANEYRFLSYGDSSLLWRSVET